MTLVRVGEHQVGWREAGAVVATGRFARAGEELVVEELEYEHVDALRALLRAVVASATDTVRVVGTAPVLGECDFGTEDDRFVRAVTVAPVRSARAVTLGDLEAAIRASWSAETSDAPDRWTPANPAFQQCDVTARVVRDYLGGEILVAGVVLDGRRVDRHAWNLLDSGLELDLSREQFLAGEQFEAPEILTEFVGRNLDERYAVLSARVREQLGNQVPGFGAGD